VLTPQHFQAQAQIPVRLIYGWFPVDTVHIQQQLFHWLLAVDFGIVHHCLPTMAIISVMGL
jgi:hypothetical protein